MKKFFRTSTRFGLRIALAVAGLAALLVILLALPVTSWRTGRVDTSPLDLIPGGPAVPRVDRIWIDTDAACGLSATSDPDDCLAIAWLAVQRAEIAGISTSFGNAKGELVLQTVRQLVDAIAKSDSAPLQIWQGSKSALLANGSKVTPAHQALQSALENGPLTILALGPLTNIAAALNGRPDLQRNVVSLVAVMGHRPGHVFHPAEGANSGMLLGHGPIFRDLNFSKDPAAARDILHMKFSTILIPYDVARHFHIDRDDLDRVSRLSTGLAWAAQRSRSWLQYWREEIGQPGFYPFDWLAAAYLTHPNIFNCAQVKAWIAKEWMFGIFPRESLLVGPSSETSETGSARNVIYCPSADERLKDILINPPSDPPQKGFGSRG